MNNIIKKRGGRRAGAGRKRKPSYLKRNELSGFRVQQWIIDWLKAQPGSGGQLVEKALLGYYKLKGLDYEKSNTV